MADNGGARRRTGRRWLWICAGIAAVGAVCAVVGVWHLPDRMYTGEEARASLQGGLLTAAAALAAVAGGLIALDETRRSNANTHVRELYSTAISQLGADSLDIRLGGIYALERIAVDSAADQRTVVEVLSAFIREHTRPPTPAPPGRRPPPGQRWRPPATGTGDGERPARPGTDVQAALTVLGRLPTRRSIPRADLTEANLTGAVLEGANFTGAVLGGANFTSARLGEANFTGAWLDGATLTGARLGWATFTGARLGEANFTGAVLGGANFTGAWLVRATLTGAWLGGADPYPCPAGRGDPHRRLAGRGDPYRRRAGRGEPHQRPGVGAGAGGRRLGEWLDVVAGGAGTAGVMDSRGQRRILIHIQTACRRCGPAVLATGPRREASRAPGRTGARLPMSACALGRQERP